MERNTLSGVYCEAKECKYNRKENKCYAPSISVIGKSATTTYETACETFKKE